MTTAVKMLIDEQKNEVANLASELAQAKHDLEQLVASQLLWDRAFEAQKKIVAAQEEKEKAFNAMHPKVARLWLRENAASESQTEVNEVDLTWHRVFRPEWLSLKHFDAIEKIADYRAYLVDCHLYVEGGTNIIHEKRLAPQDCITNVIELKILELAREAQDWLPAPERVASVLEALEKERRIELDSLNWGYLNYGLFEPQTKLLIEEIAKNPRIKIVENGLELIDNCADTEAVEVATEAIATSPPTTTSVGDILAEQAQKQIDRTSAQTSPAIKPTPAPTVESEPTRMLTAESPYQKLIDGNTGYLKSKVWADLEGLVENAIAVINNAPNYEARTTNIKTEVNILKNGESFDKLWFERFDEFDKFKKQDPDEYPYRCIGEYEGWYWFVTVEVFKTPGKGSLDKQKLLNNLLYLAPSRKIKDEWISYNNFFAIEDENDWDCYMKAGEEDLEGYAIYIQASTEEKGAYGRVAIVSDVLSEKNIDPRDWMIKFSRPVVDAADCYAIASQKIDEILEEVEAQIKFLTATAEASNAEPTEKPKLSPTSEPVSPAFETAYASPAPEPGSNHKQGKTSKIEISREGKSDRFEQNNEITAVLNLVYEGKSLQPISKSQLQSVAVFLEIDPDGTKKEIAERILATKKR